MGIRPERWMVAIAVTATAIMAVAPSARGQDREPRLRTLSVGAGFDVLRFRVEDGARMGTSGPTLTLDYAVGRRWSFGLRGAFTFPLHASQALDGQSGEGLNLRSHYDSGRSSFDLTLSVLRRLHVSARLDLVVGGGVHVRTLRLVSSEYEPIELITGGLGGLARLERAIGSHFFYGGELALAFDPLDLVHHVNRTVFAAPASLVALVGVRR